MRRILFFLVCSSMLSLICCSEHKKAEKKMEYADYTSILHNEYGLDITFPCQNVEYDGNTGVDCILTFASQNNRDYLSPVYYVGPVVSLDDYCKLMLPAIDNNEIYRSDMFPMYVDPDWGGLSSPFISMMLYNRGLGWSKYFFDEHPLDTYYSGKASFPNTTRSTIVFYITEEKKENAQAVSKQVKSIQEDKILHRSNVDDITVVRFLAPFGLECKREEWLNLFQEKGLMCYGVDFCRKDSKCFMGMLVFIRKGGKTIDDYVEQISHYVGFDPDFRFE